MTLQYWQEERKTLTDQLEASFDVLRHIQLENLLVCNKIQDLKSQIFSIETKIKHPLFVNLIVHLPVEIIDICQHYFDLYHMS